jgi:hypothetical protein
MTELFPTAVRGNAQGFCYNSGRAIGSFFPTMVGYVSQSLPLGTTIAIFSAIASGLMIVCLLLLPETRGRTLDSLEAAQPGDYGPGALSGARLQGCSRKSAVSARAISAVSLPERCSGQSCRMEETRG